MSILKKAAICAAVVLSTTSAFANFEYNCKAPVVFVGEDIRDDDPVVRVEIKYNRNDHAWRIFHHRKTGLIVSRSEQYAIQDATSERKTQWQGSLNRNRNLWMIGEMKRTDNGLVTYHEWLYDKGKGGILVMQAMAECRVAAPPLPTPTTELKGDKQQVANIEPKSVQTVPYKHPSLPTQRIVPDILNAPGPASTRVRIHPANQGASAMVDVLLGGQPIRMLLDTGATSCLINEAVAAAIVHDGQGEWIGKQKFKMADGRITSAPMVRIKELRIGPHIVTNVTAGVSDVDVMILSFPVVNGIAPFTINTRENELVWHHKAQS